MKETEARDSRPVVIYHGGCRDGFCAAWIANRFFKRERTDAEFYAGYYGVLPPPSLYTDRHVYILDFSYSREFTKHILDSARSVLMLDHHATAEQSLRGLSPNVVFDMQRSGAGMTWDYFFPGEKRSWLVDYVEDRDLWRKALPCSDAVNAYIGTIPFEFQTWSDYHDSGLSHVCVDHGETLIRKIEQYCREVSKNATRIYFDGWYVPVVNAAQCDISELLNFMLKQSELPKFSVGWFQRHDGHFQYSLRSEGDFDVSVIAKKFGGGGHKNAAGFESHRLLHLSGSMETP